MEGRTANTGSSQRDTTALSSQADCHDFFRNNREELLWMATIIVGNAPDAEECVADSMQRSDLASHISPNWIGPWIKRSVAKIAIRRTCTDIQHIAASRPQTASVATHDPSLDELNLPYLRSVSAEKIHRKIDPLERAALILHVYLGFSVPDCALLMGCQRALIAPACTSALEKLSGEEPAVSARRGNDDGHRFSEAVA